MFTVTVHRKIPFPGAQQLEGLVLQQDGTFSLVEYGKAYVDTSMPEFLYPTDDQDKLGFDGLHDHCINREADKKSVFFVNAHPDDEHINPEVIIAFQGTHYHQDGIVQGIFHALESRQKTARAALMMDVSKEMRPHFDWAKKAQNKEEAHSGAISQRDAMFQRGLEQIEQQIVSVANLMVHTYLTSFPATDKKTVKAYTLTGSTRTERVIFPEA